MLTILLWKRQPNFWLLSTFRISDLYFPLTTWVPASVFNSASSKRIKNFCCFCCLITVVPIPPPLIALPCPAHPSQNIFPLKLASPCELVSVNNSLFSSHQVQTLVSSPTAPHLLPSTDNKLSSHIESNSVTFCNLWSLVYSPCPLCLNYGDAFSCSPCPFSSPLQSIWCVLLL